MTDEMTATDSLYHAIESLPGWSGVLREAGAGYSGNLQRQVGPMLSSILLATSDAADALAVSGRIDEGGAGYLAVVTTTGVVLVNTSKISANETVYTVGLHAFSEVKELQVQARHSYFDGTDGTPRARGMSFSFTLGGQQITVGPSNFSGGRAYTGDGAILVAFDAVRDGISGK